MELIARRSVPAVRRIETDRADLYAFDIVGHVAAADVENFVRLAARRPMRCIRQIDVLVRLVDQDGVDWRRVSGETACRGQGAMRSEHVRRCAPVGEPRLVPEHHRLLRARPVELRHFALDEDGSGGMGLDRRAGRQTHHDLSAPPSAARPRA